LRIDVERETPGPIVLESRCPHHRERVEDELECETGCDTADDLMNRRRGLLGAETQ
jgi:hypothetical protein